MRRFAPRWGCVEPPAVWRLRGLAVLLAGRRLGEFGLRLSFTANGGTPEQVGVERAVRAVCPGGLIELSNGDSCGCEAGRYLDEISPNVLVCELCEVGRYCSEDAAIGGSPCPTGFTTNGLGAKSSNECGCRKKKVDEPLYGAQRGAKVPRALALSCSRLANHKKKSISTSTSSSKSKRTLPMPSVTVVTVAADRP